MNKCSTFPILCVLLLTVHDSFCSKNNDVSAFTPSRSDAEVAKSDLLRFIWQKKRRSVNPDQTTETKPQFECGDRVLTLLVRQADVVNIRIYGPLGDQLNLGQLAAFCGVSVKSTHTDVRLLFSYNSCYVKQQVSEYVLSVSWYGTDMTLSCPVSVAPPSVICKKTDMDLTVVGEGTADELSVSLNGEWAPLLYVASQCWHREPSNQGELTFLVPYTSCGVNFRDGQFIIDVRSKDKIMTLFCPYEPIPVFPVSNSRVPVNVRSQKHPGLYPKSPGFPTATAGEIAKPEQRFGQPDKPSNTPFLQPRSSWIPKIPTLPKIPSLLPGSFNLAVNFPFSVPIPTRPTPVSDRDHVTSQPVPSTSAPTPATTPDPTTSPTTSSSQQHQDLVSSFQQWHHGLVHNEQLHQELTAPVTKAPKPQLNPYMQLQKPTSSLSHAEPSVQEYQHASGLVPGTALYQPIESAHNINFPHQHQVSDTLSSLAQQLPPGYFICSYNSQQPHVPPQKFPVLQPTQPLQYQPYYYQSGHGYQASPTTPPYPPSQFIPANLQSQASPYPSYPVYQPAGPLQPQYYQKPNVQIQQSVSSPPVKESKPLTSASSQTPQYVRYEPGRDQYFDLSRGVGVQTAGTHVSSHPPYQQSYQPKFPYSPLRPEVLTGADVSTRNTGFTPPERFFQPRSFASANLQVSSNVPLESAPPTPKSPSPPWFPAQGHAHVAQLPHSQGPSFRYALNPWAPFQKPNEPDSQKPQNDSMLQSYRQVSVVKDDVVSPHLRSASREDVQQPRKAPLSGSYFYRPPFADAHK